MAFLRRRFSPLIGALILAGCQDPAPTTGTLVVNVTGLPSGANAAVRVTGPNQFFQLVRNTTTIPDLPPGDYFIARDTVIVSNTRFGVPSVRDTIAIVAGRTENVDALYAVSSGSLNIVINGLPVGVPAHLRVVGGGIDQIVAVSTVLAGLRPGTYQVIADSMTSLFGDKFQGIPVSQTLSVQAAMTPVDVSINYVLTSGSLAVTVSGLPPSVTAQGVRVTGPSGYDVRVAQSTTLRGLLVGTYLIAATQVNGACPDVYTSSDGTQTRDVTAGETSAVSVAYAGSQVTPANLNLKIDKVYLSQASQNSDGTVPMITGRPALLRVFGSANQCNSAKPKIRVTLSTGGQFDLDANEDSVRVAPDESKLTSTWNMVVPAIDVQVGMTVVAQMDVTGIVAEANETDNRFPPTNAAAIDVRTGPVIGLRFVPVTQVVNSSPLTGGVNAGNVDQYLEWSRRIHPISAYDVDIRDPYTTTSGQLTSSGTNWTQVLAEIRTLQQSEGSNRYYHGIVRVSYGSGVAGIAYVPGKAGLTWDFLPSASRIMAHEMGHNFSRSHSPCGNPAGVDQGYPNNGLYSGGRIGVFGWDPVEGLKAPDAFTDIMGYCNVQWISDYTYEGMLNYLTDPARPPTLPIVAGSEQPSLLIWGRIENGQPVLEPAFEISARPSLPVGGPHRITALADDGTEVFGVSFAGEKVADLPFEAETFAFTVPLSALRGRAVASLRLTARGKTVSSVASSDVASDPSATLTRVGPNMVRVRWDATRFPVVMVRDPVRGHILSFARGGDATIVTQRTELDLNFSNRVRSSRRLTRLR